MRAERRKDDLARELNQAVAATGSFDVLDAVTSTALSHALPDVEQGALRRQIALTTDPVRNLQLRYQLVDFLQQRNASAAAQEIDAIFGEHGKILGVVRATVDFDWNHDRKQKAVSALLDSAQISYPDLKSRFQLEAARKFTDLGDYPRSRTLLTALLTEKPLDPGYESAMAENLARANDPSELASFYRAQLDLVRKSALNRDEKQQRIGQMRRGMIAAATQLGNFNDAVDQYIELINTFPDDAALAQEAALYAVAHNARDRLFAFYQKTINDSPRDPRWSIVLARLATAAEDDALAIDAYSQAMRLRPERQDLYIAQASLDERLHRLDDAIALYRKLYTLSYRDPHWMEKVAELCARQGRNAEVVKALETGWIEGRPAKASNFFAVAERLEKWSLLTEAQHFAEQGVDQAGPTFSSPNNPAPPLMRVFLPAAGKATPRLRALRRLARRLRNSPLRTVAQQVVKQGPGAITNDEWRKQREDERRTQATAGFAAALRSMATAAAEFYTPEEKSRFAALLRQNATGVSTTELTGVYLPAVKAAGLADLTADLEWSACSPELARQRATWNSPNGSSCRSSGYKWIPPHCSSRRPLLQWQGAKIAIRCGSTQSRLSAMPATRWENFASPSTFTTASTWKAKLSAATTGCFWRSAPTNSSASRGARIRPRRTWSATVLLRRLSPASPPAPAPDPLSGATHTPR